MPNPYFIPVNPKAKLGMIIQAHAKDAKQGTATYTTRLLMETFRDEYVKMWGQEDYDAYMKELNLNIAEQQRQNLEREKQKQTRREEKLALKKKSLELKEKELSIRETNTEIRTEKIESEKPQPEPKIPEPEDPKLKEFFEDWKNRLEITETESEYVLRFRENYGSGVFTEILPIVKGFNGLFVSQGKHSFFRIPKVTGKAEMSVSATNGNVTQHVSPSPNSQ